MYHPAASVSHLELAHLWYVSVMGLVSWSLLQHGPVDSSLSQAGFFIKNWSRTTLPRWGNQSDRVACPLLTWKTLIYTVIALGQKECWQLDYGAWHSGRPGGWDTGLEWGRSRFKSRLNYASDLTHSIPRCFQCLWVVRQYLSNKTTKQKEAHSKIGLLAKKLWIWRTMVMTKILTLFLTFESCH